MISQDGAGYDLGYPSTVELADGTAIPVRVPGGTPPPRPGDAVVVTVTGPGRVYPA